MKILTIEQLGALVTQLAKEDSQLAQMLPNFTKRIDDKLLVCINEPNQRMDGREMYPTMIDKVSVCFLRLLKERPFPAGNKRIALAVLLYLLAKENLWINASEEKLVHFINWIDLSPDDADEHVLNYVTKFLKKNLEPFEN